jgi:carboxypeptidase Q
MRYFFLLLLFSFTLFNSGFAQEDKEMIRSVYNTALTEGDVYENLRFLTKDIGHRLSGSTGAAAAVEYTRQLMERYGFDTVYLQPVMVPHWDRGAGEKVRIVRSATLSNYEMNCTALGNSMGTGPDGLTGKVVEVKTLDEVEKMGREGIEGKIVFFNRPMDPTLINTFAAYGGAYDQRGHGHRVAAENGAIGVLVRSLASHVDHFAHAGTISYREGDASVPAIAISTLDAEVLSKELKRDPDLRVYMESNCKMLGEVLSYNVIGQINGRSEESQYIAVGGHLDSWDMGEGAHDDGAGCMQAIEALNILKKLNYKPQNNLRAVMWMNEENGLRGGREYAKMAREKGEKHIAAIESDRGGFVPTGFTFQTQDETTWKTIRNWEPLFKPYKLYEFKEGHGGVDISPMKEDGPVLIGLMVDPQRYFTLHHSHADVFETVDKRELELGAASLASLLYLIDRYGF